MKLVELYAQTRVAERLSAMDRRREDVEKYKARAEEVRERIAERIRHLLGG